MRGATRQCIYVPSITAMPGGAHSPPSEKTESGYRGVLVNLSWPVILPVQEAKKSTRRTPPMEITLGEFPPMEITPRVPDYSCPSLIRRRGRRGRRMTALHTLKLTHWKGRRDGTRRGWRRGRRTERSWLCDITMVALSWINKQGKSDWGKDTPSSHPGHTPPLSSQFIVLSISWG